MKVTIFYEENEKLQEKREVEHLISLYNVQELFIEDENSDIINFHKASIKTLKFAISAAQGRIKTDFNTVFIRLLNIRLNRLTEIQEESAKRLRKLYENGELRWMDDPFNKLISEMNIGLLNNNLIRLREGYYKKECKGLDDTWIWILEKELKVKEQAKEMESRIWPSSVGPIHVERMTNPHINNCINSLEKKTEKGSFERNWLAIFYDELLRRVTVDEQTKKDRADKKWEAYNNRDLTVKTYGVDIFVQDLSVKQLNSSIKELKDVTMVSILKKELETRNIKCLDDYDNDKLYLYGRNVSYMNLVNVSDGIDAIKKNPENYLENLLECMKHRRKAILFNHHEYGAIKAGLVNLPTWGLERLEKRHEELKLSNDPIEKKLGGLYADATVAVEEKEKEKETGDSMMKRYNAGELAFAYTTVDGKPGISYIQDMSFDDIVNAKSTALSKDYNPTWKKIFDLEYEKRIQQREEIERKVKVSKKLIDRYNKGNFSFVYEDAKGKLKVSPIQNVSLEDIHKTITTLFNKDYSSAWEEIFDMEFEKRANRQAEKAYNLAKRYGATPSTLEKINSEMYKKEFEEKFPDLQEFILFLKTFRM